MAKSQSGPAVWSKLASGSNAEVWIHKRCQKDMDNLVAKDRAKIQATMSKMYCQFERLDQIPPERMNRNEGRHGRHSLLVQAFKSFQSRVYGVEGSVNGVRAFFASAAGEKKTDKADPDLLKAAAARAADVTEHIPGARV